MQHYLGEARQGESAERRHIKDSRSQGDLRKRMQHVFKRGVDSEDIDNMSLIMEEEIVQLMSKIRMDSSGSPDGSHSRTAVSLFWVNRSIAIEGARREAQRKFE